MVLPWKHKVSVALCLCGHERSLVALCVLGKERRASCVLDNAPPLSYTAIPTLNTFIQSLGMSEGFPKRELSKSPPLIWLDGPGPRNALAREYVPYPGRC